MDGSICYEFITILNIYENHRLRMVAFISKASVIFKFLMKTSPFYSLHLEAILALEVKFQVILLTSNIKFILKCQIAFSNGLNFLNAA